MSNKKKHTILSCLLQKYQQGEEKSGHGITVTDLGRSMSNIQIHTETNFDVKEIDNLCYVLTNQGHVSIIKKDEDNKAHRFLITQSGQQAVIDRFYLNQIWYRQQGFWLSMVPTVIALLALAWTIYTDIKGQNEIDKLKQDLLLIKSKVK